MRNNRRMYVREGERVVYPIHTIYGQLGLFTKYGNSFKIRKYDLIMDIDQLE